MSKFIDEALSTLQGRTPFLMHGKELEADISAGMTGNTLTRTIDGAPTLSLDFQDKKRELIRSGHFGHDMTVMAGDFTYVQVSIVKTGNGFSSTFEDQAVNALRQQVSPIKVKKGVLTHVEFAARLVAEVPWLKFITVPNPSAYQVVKSKEAFTRGHPSGGEQQTSWDVLTQNAQDRGWRCYIRGVDEVWYVPDVFLFKGEPSFTFKEGENGIDNIDFEFDEGQALASMTVTARSTMLEIPPGVTARVIDLGPGNGKWLVQDISRSTFSLQTSLTLIIPQPILPEPTNKTSSKTGGSATAGDGSAISSDPAIAVAQYAMEAGFTGNNLVIAVAVSFAENRNHDPSATNHNTDGSIDRGLWQVNSVHKQYSAKDMFNPAKNADAAYAISGHGNNWTPWSTFNDNTFEQFIADAVTAIQRAKAANAASSATVGTGSGGVAPQRTKSHRALDFVNEALSQRGKAYVYGAQTSPTNNDPKSFDCSLLVEWAAGRVGVTLPRTSGEQWQKASAAGTLVSVAHAARVRGAILFEGFHGSQHVVISLGNGETIEARGQAYGVNEFGIAGRPFSAGALIPGMDY